MVDTSLPQIRLVPERLLSLPLAPIATDLKPRFFVGDIVFSIRAQLNIGADHVFEARPFTENCHRKGRELRWLEQLNVNLYLLLYCNTHAHGLTLSV